MSAFDSTRRTLTPGEVRQRDRFMPALQAWTAYLTASETAPTGAFERAEQRRSAVLLRHRQSLDSPLKAPVAVCPLWAFEWAVANGHRGNPGTGSALTHALMAHALDFMRAQPARTFRPLHDHCDRRRRDGFYHLTGEMHTRLWSACYVPVLTPRAGRPLSHDRPVTPRTASGRAMRLTVDDRTMDVVRDWVRVNPVTALREVALREGRPLVVRSAGRPSSSSRNAAQVARGHVLGTVAMLHRHAVEHAGRGGWRTPSEAELAAALCQHAEATPAVLSPVTRFATPDAPARSRVRDWWRFALPPLGQALIDPLDLLPEITHFEATRSSAAEPVPAGPSRDFHGLVLPADAEPEYLDDPDYRLMVGVSDEDYERWKAGE